jgi:hypothetical protein
MRRQVIKTANFEVFIEEKKARHDAELFIKRRRKHRGKIEVHRLPREPAMDFLSLLKANENNLDLADIAAAFAFEAAPAIAA